MYKISLHNLSYSIRIFMRCRSTKENIYFYLKPLYMALMYLVQEAWPVSAR